MKYFISLTIFVVILLSGCKKSNNQTDENKCSTSTYQISLDSNYYSVQLTEDDESNCIVLCEDASQTMLIKIDAEGNILWNKTVVGNRKPLEILSLDDNSFIVMRQGEIIEEELGATPENVFIQNGLYGDSCLPTYEYGSVSCWKYHGTLELMKFSPEGVHLWTKEINHLYAGDNSLIANTDQSFLLIAADMYGRQPVPQYDSNQVFLNKINLPLDSNKIQVLNISYDGNIIWQKTINNILNGAHDDHFSPSINNTKVGDILIIKTMFELIKVDSEGEVLGRTKIYPTACHGRLYCLIDSGDESFIFSGEDFGHYGSLVAQRNTSMMNINGEILWTKDVVLHLLHGNENGFVTFTNNEINYYNPNGSLKWRMESDMPLDIKMNCRNGITMVSYLDGKIVLTRTDDMGAF